MKAFNVPIIYRSPLIAAVKNKRRREDKLKKDFSPTLLDFGALRIWLARHFGFCYGVENAIEIAFRTIEENPGKRIFLLSEMIHNPQVNNDLLDRGVRFLHDTLGNPMIPLSELAPDDVVIIPAFGTTIAMQQQLSEIGLTTAAYNTTCPFVEKVWNRAAQIAEKGYSIVVHGKPKHEETRATFSHAAENTPTIIVNDLAEAHNLAAYIRQEKSKSDFYREFANRYSGGFDPEKDLQRIGVVNQTTQLATETQAIADYLKQVMISHYQLTPETIAERFADTRDTLCYATNDNQTAVTGMLETPAQLAIVVGGYNSSNTTHLAELCETKLPTYFIDSDEKMLNDHEILHFDIHRHQEILSANYLPNMTPVDILLTSGASCPDALVESVIQKLTSFYKLEKTVDELIGELR